ncbi:MULTISPECIES: hypothetical protein [unclassified Microbacterium]|uniref:hypothetical protein n=1 Tax=unclassified Microbacterium TaxID=2609290 RepID=UPI003C2E55E4
MGNSESVGKIRTFWTVMALLLGIVGGVLTALFFGLTAENDRSQETALVTLAAEAADAANTATNAADAAVARAAAASAQAAADAAATARTTVHISAVAVVGIIIAGIGTVFRALADGRQEGWKAVDFLGKLLATSAFMFAVMATSSSVDGFLWQQIMAGLGWFVVFCAFAACAWHIRAVHWIRLWRWWAARLTAMWVEGRAKRAAKRAAKRTERRVKHPERWVLDGIPGAIELISPGEREGVTPR